MRARNIKPGFFENELLVELPYEFRLLFIGLWTMADKSGRLEDRPKKIKMCIFPADDVDVNRGLTELHRYGFIQRYESFGSSYIQVVNWEKHQRPHHTERESVIPPLINGEITVNSRNQDGENPPDSLIPDSLIKNPPTPLQGGDDTKPKKKRTPKDPDAYTPEFEKAWAAYPRKDGKRKAFEAWQKATKRDMPVDDMPEHIESRSFEQDWRKDEGRFIPHMATWLNRDGWLDEGAKIAPRQAEEEGDFWDVGFYHDAPEEMPKPGEVLS